jgi:hypothetical protein
MTNKFTLLSLLLLCSLSLFSQSKKNQILRLSHQADSLNQIIIKERGINNKKVKELEIEISNLKKEIVEVQQELTLVKNDLQTSQMELLIEENLKIQMIDTIYQLKNKIKQSIEINPFVGSWYDNNNCWISITELNENLNISYHAGPCQGDLKGIFLKDKYELIHENSECNYRGFNNDHILGKKIGYATIINGQLVLDLTIGDDLLEQGGQVFIRNEE